MDRTAADRARGGRGIMASVAAGRAGEPALASLPDPRVLVGAGSVALGFTGQALQLPNWFVRRRGLAMSIAFSASASGSIVLLPWLQSIIEHAGWRAACTGMAIVVFGLLARR